jgi:formylglycine-generating enzyme required for sulfatase activity
MHCFATLIYALLAAIFALPAVADQPLSPERERALTPAASFRECDRCPEMVVVPAGSFTMGSPESEKGRNTWEGPTRVVAFGRPFAVGKFEVTVDQFAAFIRDAAYKAGTNCWTFEAGAFDKRNGRGWQDPGYPQNGSHPAACLSWRDAKAYVEWLSRKSGGKGYRLLSEAEWEYATRARSAPGPAPRFSFGDDDNGVCAHGNALDQTAKGTLPGTAGKWEFVGCSDGHAYTAPVGLFAANKFGLHDMHGNVKEWIEDCFQEGQGYRGAPADGSASVADDCRLRVQRGGSWLSYGRLLRAAMRFRGGADDRASDIGFRVARTLLAQ